MCRTGITCAATDLTLRVEDVLLLAGAVLELPATVAAGLVGAVMLLLKTRRTASWLASAMVTVTVNTPLAW